MKTTFQKIYQHYATALYQLSQEQKCTQEILTDVQTLQSLIGTNTALQRILSNPFVKSEKVDKVFQQILQKIDARPLTRNFVAVVVRNGRAGMLAHFLDSFIKEVEVQAGYVRSKLSVAVPLTESQHHKLSTILQKLMDREVYFDVTVDPSLLGGFILHIGSRMIDASLKSQLQSLYNTLNKKEAVTIQGGL